MYDALLENEILYQEEIVIDIENEFGEPYCYYNENGNLAISKTVLKEFRKLTPDYVWDRSERYWRKREKGEDLNKRQSDY